LLSVGRDNKCFVWSLNSFTKSNEIKYTEHLNNDTNQRMKHARFVANDLNRENPALYTSFIPRIRGGDKDLSSYLVRWTYKSVDAKFVCRYETKRRIRNTIVTTMEPSADGQMVCVGDYEGNILLFDYDMKELVRFKRQHSSVITDLAFCHDMINNDTSAGVKQKNTKAIAANDGEFVDKNKLILTISIDRTLQCYKYNVSKSNGLAAHLMSNFAWMNKFDVFSPTLLKFFLYVLIFVVLFCQYFMHIE